MTDTLRPLTVVLLLLMTGCTAVPIEYYSTASPGFDPREYFQGEIEAWGIVQDWRGRVTRRFYAEIDAQNIGEKIELHEKFRFDDGENSSRTWQIDLQDDGLVAAAANDIVGTASGKLSGNAMKLSYQIDLLVDGKTHRVTFNDVLWKIDNNVLFNRATIKKFGIKVGEVALFMKKT